MSSHLYVSQSCGLKQLLEAQHNMCCGNVSVSYTQCLLCSQRGVVVRVDLEDPTSEFSFSPGTCWVTLGQAFSLSPTYLTRYCEEKMTDGKTMHAATVPQRKGRIKVARQVPSYRGFSWGPRRRASRSVPPDLLLEQLKCRNTQLAINWRGVGPLNFKGLLSTRAFKSIPPAVVLPFWGRSKQLQKQETPWLLCLPVVEKETAEEAKGLLLGHSALPLSLPPLCHHGWLGEGAPHWRSSGRSKRSLAQLLSLSTLLPPFADAAV